MKNTLKNVGYFSKVSEIFSTEYYPDGPICQKMKIQDLFEFL